MLVVAHPFFPFLRLENDSRGEEAGAPGEFDDFGLEEALEFLELTDGPLPCHDEFFEEPLEALPCHDGVCRDEVWRCESEICVRFVQIVV